jgi:hypothetical protein
MLSLASPEIVALLRTFPADCDRSVKSEFLYMWLLEQVETQIESSTFTPIIPRSAARLKLVRCFVEEPRPMKPSAYSKCLALVPAKKGGRVNAIRHPF